MNDLDLIASRRLKPPPGEEFWVFAYGSLMWRPGFACLEARPALLRGYHRAFCIYSVLYRGTPERPGLVLGLDRGGACRGRALRVAAEHAEAVAIYLHEREMVTGVYEPRWLPVDVEGRRIRAVTYVADRNHEQYTGKLDPDRIVEMILKGEGKAGSNRAYLENTVGHLDELGIADGALHDLLRLVEARATREEPRAVSR
jgi:glutathione-specific gamma-glutamylcyclotransferase